MAIAEALGRALGYPLVPLFVVGTKLRGARVFHPDGTIWEAEVEPLSPRFARLGGPAFVRLGGAAWRKEREWPDVLGVTIRFGTGREGHVDGEVDLLLCTFRKPWLLPAAFATTDTTDYLANTYWSGVPYDVEGVGREALALLPERPSPAGNGRVERLARAVHSGEAALRLEADGVALARIRLVRRADVDPARLRFAPHLGGRGLAPRGVLTGMRSVVYPKSQDARA